MVVEKNLDNHCCENNSLKSSKIFEYLSNFYSDYKPLLIIFIYCLSLAMLMKNNQINAMNIFMGMFFIFFSLFKFFDLHGFVTGFLKYDIIARNFKFYGYLYPFFEFTFGIAYLTNFLPVFTNSVVIIFMLVSGIGVLKSMISGSRIKCACLGNILNVPLSIVSLVENFGMALMASYSLYHLNLELS